MTKTRSLNTYIPIEHVKQNKKLQEVKCKLQTYLDEDSGEWEYEEGLKVDPMFNVYPAPTIADIIDNAESLFSHEDYGFKNKDLKYWYQFVQKKILYMCQQNKSIEEISEYIIKNIT